MTATSTDQPPIVVTGVVVQDDAGRVLTVRKRGTQRFMLPGGKLEDGETFAQTASREVEEELGRELGDVPEIDGISAGGMPTRVKCLHALAGHVLAAGPGVVDGLAGAATSRLGRLAEAVADDLAPGADLSDLDKSWDVYVRHPDIAAHGAGAQADKDALAALAEEIRAQF